MQQDIKRLLYEMYGKDNWGFLGNENLMESKTYEIGYRWSNGDIVFFKTDIDNLLKYENSICQ